MKIQVQTTFGLHEVRTDKSESGLWSAWTLLAANRRTVATGATEAAALAALDTALRGEAKALHDRADRIAAMATALVESQVPAS